MASCLLAVAVPAVSPKCHAAVTFPAPLIARAFHFLMRKSDRNRMGIDRKLAGKVKAKKIAQGHAKDDREEMVLVFSGCRRG